jgi:hypothetical protein
MSDNTVSVGPTSFFKPFEIRMYPGHMQPILAMPASGAAGRVAGGRIEMVFGPPSRRYSPVLLTLFVLAGLTTAVSLIGLILGPLYGSERIAIALYFGLSIGLGILALIVRRAQITHQQNK